MRAFLLALSLASLAASPAAAQEAAGERWCAPELDQLDEGLCFSTSKGEGATTLVIFLHGVIQPDSGWQWAQQRAAARLTGHGVSVLMPRGRRGIGPRGMADWWGWPTGASAQATAEREIIEGWARAREAFEQKTGKKAEKIWVFGFSNGGYYAADLALRSRLSGADAPLRAEGFGVFAGGSGAPHLERAARQASEQTPIFVGWGGKDKAHGDQVKLAQMLRRVGWPAKSEGAPGAGHAMVDRHVADAVEFLRATRPKIAPKKTGLTPLRSSKGRRLPLSFWRGPMGGDRAKRQAQCSVLGSAQGAARGALRAGAARGAQHAGRSTRGAARGALRANLAPQP